MPPSRRYFTPLCLSLIRPHHLPFFHAHFPVLNSRGATNGVCVSRGSLCTSFKDEVCTVQNISLSEVNTMHSAPLSFQEGSWNVEYSSSAANCESGVSAMEQGIPTIARKGNTLTPNWKDGGQFRICPADDSPITVVFLGGVCLIRGGGKLKKYSDSTWVSLAHP